jgi:MoxR-like ATPase
VSNSVEGGTNAVQRVSPLGRSSARFAAYFQELREAFLERDDVLQQIALALLAREHVLLMGPPGTAKSQLARAVLGRILDATTGEPSLFARQFTENTVLTDLVGPLDFKTLMDTGRSQHFTDEGVIGSVHAFLDEVFDGRDMLLRSTLNLLGERELKQGKSTVRGRIECSLMTSNRYLTEVLEESKDSLLAFVDRIAFVGFVPKGFSSDQPMRRVMRQNLGNAPKLLHANLTIQDLDLLQSSVDRVRIVPEACDRLVQFLDVFEAEMAAAVRAIPDFAPSRYLSIRTRVRVGKLLKAVVVYRRATEDAERPLEVEPGDFDFLRLALLQSGPPPALLERLAQEQDPREARQLKIIKIEREVFERCLARLERATFRAPAAENVVLEPAAWASASLEALLELVERASDDVTADPLVVAQLSQAILARLIERGLEQPTAEAANREAFAQLLERVERARGPVDPLVRFLRQRSLALLEAAVEREILRLEALSEAGARRGATDTIALLAPVAEQLSGWLEEAEKLGQSAPGLALERLRGLVELAAGAMTCRLREAFYVEANEVKTALATTWDVQSPSSLRLRYALQATHAFEARLLPIHPVFAGLLDGVVAPAVLPLAKLALAPLGEAPRVELLPRFDAIWATLAEAELGRHLPVDEILAVVLALAAEQDRRAWSVLETPATTTFSVDAHERLRRAVPRSSLCFVGVQLCLRLDAQCVREFAQSPDLAVLAKRLAALPEALRQELQHNEVKRSRVWLEFLSAWLDHAELAATLPAELFGLLRVLEQDGVATRLRLEAELVESILPAAATECAALKASVDALLARVRAAVAARAPTA